MSVLYLFLFVNIVPAVIASLNVYNPNVNSLVLGNEDQENIGESSKYGNTKQNEVAKKAKELQKESEKNQREISKGKYSETNNYKDVTVTVSPEGIKTVTETETNGNNVRTEIKTYDINGNRIGESKLQEQKNGTDIKTTVYDSEGVESKYQFKDKNGSVVMLKIREGDNSWSKLLYNEKNGMLLVRQKTAPTVTNTETDPSSTDEGTPANEPETLAIRINEGGSFDLISGGISATTTLPVEVDGEEGKVYVDDTEVLVNPDEVAQEAEMNQSVKVIETVTLTKENGLTVYKVTGFDTQKFLGLFDVTLPKTLYYSVDTNTLISESKTAIQTLLDAFSF